MAENEGTDTQTTEPQTPQTPQTTTPESVQDRKEGVPGSTDVATKDNVQSDEELERLRREVSQRDELLGHYRKVSNAEDPFASDVIGSTTAILRASGKTDEEIRAIINQATQQRSQEEEKKVPEDKVQPEDRNDELAEMRRQLESLTKQQGQDRVQRFNQDLGAAVKTALDGNEAMRELLNLSERRGLDSKKAVETISSQVEARLRSNLRSRLELEGQPATYEQLQSIVQQEVGKAVKDVDGVFRTVIGAPSDLAKAPETAVESLRELAASAPEKFPEWEPGKGKADLEYELDRAIAGSLARGATESQTIRSL